MAKSKLRKSSKKPKKIISPWLIVLFSLFAANLIYYTYLRLKPREAGIFAVESGTPSYGLGSYTGYIQQQDRIFVLVLPSTKLIEVDVDNINNLIGKKVQIDGMLMPGTRYNDLDILSEITKINILK